MTIDKTFESSFKKGGFIRPKEWMENPYIGEDRKDYHSEQALDAANKEYRTQMNGKEKIPIFLQKIPEFGAMGRPIMSEADRELQCNQAMKKPFVFFKKIPEWGPFGPILSEQDRQQQYERAKIKYELHLEPIKHGNFK